MPLHADAMVILMGSFAERVAHGVDLYSTGQAENDNSRGEHGFIQRTYW